MKHSIAFALLTSFAIATPALADSSPTVAATHAVGVTVPVPTSSQAPAQAPADSARYADRQRHDKSVENFEGGAVVLVASGGAVLVALVVLILLL